MPSDVHPIVKLLRDDPRYKIEAYQFVRDALAYAHEKMGLGRAAEGGEEPPEGERHLTGQQLCEAIRRYALEQYGYMAKLVLNNWGLHRTGDFGDIVYNLIGVGLMRKSEQDRREDFNDQYDFDDVFVQKFKIVRPD